MNTGTIRHACAASCVIALILTVSEIGAQTTAWDATSNVVLKTMEFHETPLAVVIDSLNAAISANLSNSPAVTIRLNCTPPQFIKCATNPVVVARMDHMIECYLKREPPDVWNQRLLESRPVTLNGAYLPLHSCIKILTAVQGLGFRYQTNDILIGANDAGKTLECRAFPVPETFLTRISEASSNTSPSMQDIDVGGYFWANSKMPAPPMWSVPGTNCVVRMDTKEGNARFATMLGRMFRPANE
jgi:hypothetical protein